MNEEYSWLNKIPNNKKIGVITPYYNDKNRLFKLLNSVKSQTLSNVFHYIYDDASDDDLEQIYANELRNDPNIIYVKGKNNVGQSRGRNILIDIALNNNCEYIAFLDSDDQWLPNHLELALQNLKDSYDIVYSPPNILDENNNPLFSYNIPIPKTFIGKQLLHNNFIWISSVVCKAKCFTELRFDSNLNSIEDWDLWISLFKAGFNFIRQEETTINYIVKISGQAEFGNAVKPKIEKKHQLLNKLKLHLACGLDYHEDYINIDLYPIGKVDAQFDVLKLPYDDNTIDEIKAFHIIEHFDFFEGQEALKEWFRVLKPGGKLYLETPDFLETCKAFIKADADFKILLYGHFFAHPWVPGQTHKFLFTEDQLRIQLNWAGFNFVERVAPASKYVRPDTVELFLTVNAYKPNI